jgi:type VII secretion integral membrane protein EccD
MLSASDPGLRRVAVHAGTSVADLALPAAVPVVALIPSIVDILGGPDPAKRYELSCLGAPAMSPSTTLAQQGILDGAVLLLSEPGIEPPVPRCEDAAEAVATALAAAAPPREPPTRLNGVVAAVCLAGVGCLTLTRNTLAFNTSAAAVAASAGIVALLFAAIAHRAYREPLAALGLSIVATMFAALAGFLTVPGGPGSPNLLLAAMAAAVTAVVAMRVTVRGVALTALSCFVVTVAVAAFAGVITAAPPHAIGAAAALGSLGLLCIAGRASIALAGLSRVPRADPDGLAARAIRADAWLTSLRAAFSSSAAVGAIVAAATPPGDAVARLGCIAFTAATAALLLLRARLDQALVLVVSGTVTAGAAFAVAAIQAPTHGPWIAAGTAILAAAPIYLGFVAPALHLSPVARRGIELLECLTLVAMVPLACWICGIYGAVRSLNPPWI